jgi:hypothetical protein
MIAGILLLGEMGKKVGMELVVLADVDRVHPIWQPHFFQHD